MNTFSGLSIFVSEGSSEIYTIAAWVSAPVSASTDTQSFLLSLDGDTDLTVDPTGTQMGATVPITNGAGSRFQIAATELRYTTQPPATAGVGLDFAGNIVLAGTDVNGNIDLDFTRPVTVASRVFYRAALSAEVDACLGDPALRLRR